MGAYFFIFARFIPLSCAPLASDYSQFFTWLVDGALWFKVNGPFAVPWFTPPFCGGLPKFAHPHSLYYSVPQLLTLLGTPAQAVRWTLLLFAIAGFAGAYRLSRRAFGLDTGPALVVACLFLFNGFVAHRMIAGHLRYHAFMLLPWVACGWLAPAGRTRSARFALGVVLPALGLAYALYSGMVAELIGFGLGLLLVLALHTLLQGEREPLKAWAPRALGSLLLSLLLCAAQLSASLTYVAQFRRSDYLLPGFSSLVSLWGVLCSALFFPPADELARSSAVNVQWLIERHELEYGVTWVPLLLLGLWAVRGLRARSTGKGPGVPSRLQLVTGLAMLLLCAIPIALNVYTPGWNAWIKRLPVLGSASLMLRLFVSYIPLLCLLAGLAIQRSALARPAAAAVSAGAIALVLGLNLWTDRTHYLEQRYYDGAHLCQRLQQTRHQGQLPAIDRIVERGRDVSASSNALIDGASLLECYDPMLGYEGEAFPRGDLQPGPIDLVVNGHFNLKNPACYLFPEENRCRPGDPFRLDQREEMLAFAAYRPFAFALPAYQRLADWASLLGLLVVAGFLLFAAGTAIAHRGRTPASGKD